MTKHKDNFFYNIEKSALVTIIGVLLLFSGAVIVTLIAPSYLDSSWTTPSSAYQVQMYEVSDPNLYISSSGVQAGSSDLQFVYHLRKDYTLLAFDEDETLHIVAPQNLEKYITRPTDSKLKLTSDLLLLRKPESPKDASDFDAVSAADQLRKQLSEQWDKDNPDSKKKGLVKPDFNVMELYAPSGKEAFALAPRDGTIENWVDQNFTILDEDVRHPYHKSAGVIYVKNPMEYRIVHYKFGDEEGWRYDLRGESIKNLTQLKSHKLGFRSRQDLIQTGENIYKVEGCWYCHTDQTRTLVQDVVLNGSDSYPAPPSSANEYVYQKTTFPGTKRNGPDISRTGIKRPSRDWHRGHFWSPKTASKGSIMPAFQHFFDNDPRGTAKGTTGIPNYKFEAIYQYLMTKGTRITPPTQAWWVGKDPIQTKEIIEGRRRLP